ncbi:hypothetical protein R1flu_008502 [Riccia fluitans]|uniref:Uncharacterized protein n=1 Tax=Riccia fluitans TaxID=41844 RepID=A0ABD1YFG1_9MARC
MGAIALPVEAIRSVPARPVYKTVIEGDNFVSGGKDFASGGDSFVSGGNLFCSRLTEIRCLIIRSNDKVCKTVIEGDDFAGGGEDLASGANSFANGGDSFAPTAKFILSTYTRRQRPLLELKLC